MLIYNEIKLKHYQVLDVALHSPLPPTMISPLILRPGWDDSNQFKENGMGKYSIISITFYFLKEKIYVNVSNLGNVHGCLHISIFLL